MLRYSLILVVSVLVYESSFAQGRKKGSSGYVDGWALGATVSYPVIGRKFEFSGKRTSTNQKINATYEFESQPGISLFVKRSKENGFGFFFGYEKILTANLNGGTTTVGSTSYNTENYSYMKNISFDIFQIGTEYRWTQIYIPINFLLSMPSMEMKPGPLGYGRGLASGYSLGLGYLINRNFFGEIVYRNIGFYYSESLSTGNNPPKDDYGTGFSKEITINLGVML